MKRLGLFVLGAVLLAPAGASAAETGFELGTRLGYGIPMGSVSGEEDADFKDWTGGQIPIWLDIGYRATPNIFVGAYVSYGFASVGSSLGDICDASGVDCSARSLRLGAQLQYHFMPGESMDGWGGLGIGWESSGINVSGPGAEVTIITTGFEFGMLQGGLDFQVADSVALGPFLGLSVGQFSSYSCDGDDVACAYIPDGNIDNKALHEWLFLGVRGAFGPF